MSTFLSINRHTFQSCCPIPPAFEFCSLPQVAARQHFVCKLSPAGFPLNRRCVSKHSLWKLDWKLRPGPSVSCSVSRNAGGVGERSGVDGDLAGVSTAFETQVLEREGQVPRDEQREDHTQKQDTLISAHGWGVLRIDHDDIDLLKQFADVQAETFHVTTALFNDFCFAIFKGEILSSILHKIRHATPNRYACLAALPDCLQPRRRIVGVVDAAAMTDRDVLRGLPGVDEYLYISGMAVDSKYRRQKVATALLEACDLTAMQWGFKALVLQAYEDDTAARSLYSRAGYTVISADPLWLSTWLGRRRRVIMAKKISHCAVN